MTKKLRTILAVGTFCAFSTTFPCLASDAPIDPVAKEKKIYSELKEKYKDKFISLDEFKKVVDEVNAGQRPNTYILDVRTDQEFYTFHIEGSDHIHSGHFYLIPKKIPDVNADIYLLCRTGHRTVYVIPYLVEFGYKNIKMLDGGILSWVKAGYPVVNQYMGKFVAKYENFDKDYKPDFRDKDYRVREFHPF